MENNKFGPNINIEINPQISINNGECDAEYGKSFVDKMIGKYELNSYEVLLKKLCNGNPRSSLYSIDSFKSYILDIITSINNDKLIMLYESYIIGLVDHDISNQGYEKMADECITNIVHLFGFLSRFRRLKNESFGIHTMPKDKYNIILHSVTVALIGEYTKYKTLRNDFIEKKKVTTNRMI